MIRALIVQALIALALLVAPRAGAETTSACSAYFAATTSDASGFAPVVPEKLLANWQGAVPCLIQVVKSISAYVTSPIFRPDVRIKYLSATAALRAISSKLNSDDEKRCKGDPKCPRELDKFIQVFRDNDNIDVAAALTYGARSDNEDVRLNSILILGNVVDNTTVCVPLTHLADLTWSMGQQHDYDRRGRANLLGTIAVVAPWAYSENFKNIQDTKEFFWNKIDREDPNLEHTVAILKNIQARLNTQTKDTNRGAYLADDVREACKKYVERYRPPVENKDTVRYLPH